MNEQPPNEQLPNEQPPLRQTRGLDVNLLPERYRRRRVTGTQLVIIAAMAIVIALLLPLYLMLGSVLSQNAQLQLDLRAVTQQVQAKRDKLKSVTQLQAQAIAYKSVAAEQGKLNTELQTVSDKAAAISGIVLKTIAVEGNKMVLSGTADTDAALAAYRAALQQEWGAKVGEPTLVGQNAPWTFTITIEP